MTTSTSDPTPHPVPGDRSPSSPGWAGLRASDTDREQVSTLLSTAYAEGRLTRDEHDERLEQVLRARTFDDLVPLTSDLVPTSPAAGTLSSPAPSPVAPAGATDQPERMIAVFGGVTRRGRWRLRRRTQSLALFGGVNLDLREAVFDAAEVEISGLWCFGGLEITVPEGMAVVDQTIGVFGGTDVRDLGERDPRMPTLVLRGTTLFGGVSVKGPKPTRQQRRDARGHRRHGCG